MNSFNQTHLDHIRGRFTAKTGVAQPPRRTAGRSIRTGVFLAAALLCLLATTAFAVSLFSSLSGDELSLSATYEGDGLVSIRIENKSDKTLRLEPTLKLMQWSTGQEVTPLSHSVSFQNTEIPAHESGTVTVDLSDAYDIALLETPLADGDWYYLVLTNNHFSFGQDWMCTVIFAQPVETVQDTPDPIAPGEADKALVAQITEELRPYFEGYTADPEERNKQAEEYLTQCRQLLAQVDGTVVSPVSPLELTVAEPVEPVIFDPSVPSDLQLQLTGLNYHIMDGYNKLVGASDTDRALVLSALIPHHKGDTDGGADIPLLYIFTYEKSDIQSPKDYAFIRGQLLTFEQMEPYKIYEDETYICYEVSALFYTNLRQYVESMVSQRTDVFFDEQIWAQVENIYSFYRENLGSLITYRDDTRADAP